MRLLVRAAFHIQTQWPAFLISDHELWMPSHLVNIHSQRRQASMLSHVEQFAKKKLATVFLHFGKFSTTYSPSWQLY